VAALLHAGLDICVSLSDNTDSITTSQRLEESREGDGGQKNREREIEEQTQVAGGVARYEFYC